MYNQSMKTSTQKEKSSRLNLRASRKERQLIARGAARRGENVSAFVLRSACKEAELALAEQTSFAVSATAFQRFVDALDRPARVVPALHELLKGKAR